MNEINELVNVIESLEALKTGHDTFSLSDLSDALSKVPRMLDLAYDVQKQQRDMQEFKVDVSSSLARQEYNYEFEKAVGV